ncbi:hypothetical protein EAH_00013970 [Eimeria acervulina]|uniref:Uncharacterized protein n=1 Tax=Eimeria acervulina TaxID=5801 RepID=U6GLN1_EIMAC|nr:hypothetical protein EAH_00013970 [Eimeria acervulina]CDI80198.1 hypothetical protein EAH_00013970 [Eimeria acervulina]
MKRWQLDWPLFASCSSAVVRLALESQSFVVEHFALEAHRQHIADFPLGLVLGALGFDCCGTQHNGWSGWFVGGLKCAPVATWGTKAYLAE